jgi:hypothetical protein
MGKSLRFCSPLDQLDVSLLRSEAYARDGSMKALSVSTNWNLADDHYLNLGAYNHSQLISVMRLEWAFTKEGLHERLQFAVDTSRVKFPVAVLGKAGTIASASSQGLNTLLRYHLLQVVYAWNFSALYGTMIEGSPRVGSMEEMGYEFTTNVAGWKGLINSTRPALVGRLDASKFKSALAWMKSKLGDTLTAFEVQYDIPSPPGSLARKMRKMSSARRFET